MVSTEHEDGRIVIPAKVRRHLNLKPGDTLVAESDGQSLLLRSYDQVLQATQEFFRQFVPPGTSAVEELIAERRAEAAREDGEAGVRPVSRRAPAGVRAVVSVAVLSAAVSSASPAGAAAVAVFVSCPVAVGS